MNRQGWKKVTSVLLVLALFLSFVNPALVRAADGSDQGRIKQLLERTVDYYKATYQQPGTDGNKKVLGSWMTLVGLWGAGVNLNDGSWSLPDWKTKDPGLKPTESGTDHIRYIFGLLAMGENPASAWETERNLYAELAAQQNTTTGAIGGVNKHVWAMLALDTGKEQGQYVGKWNQEAKQKALQFLLGSQKADGGFSLSSGPNGTGDTDITGMALLALSKYQDNSAADQAIKRAKELLKQRQLDTGGINAPGMWGAGDNSNSLATTVSGVVATGESMLTEKWVQGGHNVLDALINFQRADGAFDWKVGEPGAYSMATEQVLIALADMQHEKSTWTRLAEQSMPPEEGLEIPVDPTVDFEYGSEQMPPATNKITLVFTTPQLPRVTTVTSSTYMDIPAHTWIETSGWNQRVELPRHLSTSDEGTVANLDAKLQEKKLEVKQLDDRIKVGGDQDIRFSQHVILAFKGLGAKEAAFVDGQGALHLIPKVDRNASVTEDVYAYASENGDLVIKTKHFTEFLAYQASPIESGEPTVPPGNGGNESGGNGGVTPPPVTSTITLSVERRTFGGTDIIAPATLQLQQGDTAFTALMRAANERNIPVIYSGSGASIYVRGINGLSEFDGGPLSGWMYSVNGVFPNYSAGLYTLKAGDVLRWQYTTSLGEDLGQLVPTTPPTGGAGGIGGGVASGTGKEQQALLTELTAQVNSASAWIGANRNFSVQDNFNDWDVLALARSGKEIPSAYYSVLEQYVKEKKGDFRLVTDYERMALAVSAIGKDPANVAGYNLLEKIYNHPRMTNQGTNGLVYALIALDAKATSIPSSALWTRDKLLKELLAQQLEDGGFPISKSAKGTSDMDMTAMALQALAKYQDHQDVKAATERALSWLSKQQLNNGGFKAFGVETSESISQVIIALTSLGVDLNDKSFVKEGSLLSALKAYQNKDGGFAHEPKGESNYMATHQALLALSSYERALKKQSRLYDMSDIDTSQSVVYADENHIASWAKAAVQRATAQGLMGGTGGQPAQFEPKRGITRAEFAALVVRAAGEEPMKASARFQDVEPGAWYAGYIETAVAKGYLNGVSDSSFQPNQIITRQEMAAILVRVKGLTPNGEAASALKDINKVSKWAVPYVNTAVQEGLMTGDAGNFNPTLPVTREMAAVVMMRAAS